MYIANHYVRIGSRVYIKGESIPENLSEEKIKWLKEAGAIHKVASAYTEDGKVPTVPDPCYQEEDEPDSEEDSEDEADPEEDSEDEAEEISEEREDDDPEPDAPEIDVMAGIVGGPKKKKTTTARKGTAKK